MLFRSRLGPSVRSGPDGPRARDDHRDLPVRLRRVPTLHPQDRAGPYGDRSHATQDRGRHIMKRKVDSTWRLAELMAARGLHNTTDLIPMLAARAIPLSRPQCYRLLNQPPARLSPQAVDAPC